MKHFGRNAICLTLILVCMLLSTISVFAGSVTEGKLEERSTTPRSLLSVSVASEAALKYDSDIEGNTLGVGDFYVDGDTISLLSKSTNEVLQYRNNVLQCRICLDDFGIYGTDIASKGNMLFVLDSWMGLHTFINNRIVSTLDLYERRVSETISEFRVEGDKLLLCVIGYSSRDYITHYITVSSDGSLSYEKAVNMQLRRMNTDVSDADIEDFKTEIKKDARIGVSSMRNGLATHTLKRISAHYLGETDAGAVVMEGREELKDTEGSLYSYDKLYVLNRSSEIERELLLPLQRKYIHEQTKMIDHRIYFLNAQEDTVSVLDLTDCEQFGTVMDSTWFDAEIDYTEEQEQARIAAIQPRYAVTRDAAVETAKSYYTHYWTCSASNLASLSGWTKPSYLNGAGTYRSVPYCWGGFDTLDSFDEGLLNGDRAGNTSKTYLTNTRGVDCSGLVSRCWNLSSKYGTSTLASICTAISYAEVEPGDIFLKVQTSTSDVGHVRLFAYMDENEKYVTFESTMTDGKDRVIKKEYTQTDLKNTGYKAYRYNNIWD